MPKYYEKVKLSSQHLLNSDNDLLITSKDCRYELQQKKAFGICYQGNFKILNTSMHLLHMLKIPQKY